MNLITVTNGKFLDRALNLIGSFLEVFPKNEVFLFYFPPINSEKIEKIEKINRLLQVQAVPVDKVCEHAHDPNVFFFKSYALYQGYLKSKEPVIYLDSAFVFLRYPDGFLERLDKYSRVLIPYPQDTNFENDKLCTEKAFELLGCTEERYKKANHYWAAIQAYKHTDENLAFLQENYNSMLNIEIAGPSNLLSFPDGRNSPAKSHRNDQSVLSILIEKYGYQQPFDEFSQAYCDIDTLLCGYPEKNFSYVAGKQLYIRGRQNTTHYIPKEFK